MNKKTITLIILTLLYSLLFYEQHVGVNFLIFTISIIGFFYLQYKESFQKRSVLLLSFSALFAATFALIYGSTLSMWSTIIALMVLPGAVINQRSNVLTDFGTSLVNVVASTTFMILEMVESGKQGKGKVFLNLLKYIVPLVFIILFFFIYRVMNPLFEELTQEIADIISVEWVFFTLGGFTLMYSIFRQKRSEKLDLWEKEWLINILPESVKKAKWNEAVGFIILFIALNLMLISVNILDLNYLYWGETLPGGIAHKQFVHKGVGTLILSIVLGISILLYFFRGDINFSKNKNSIKLLAYIWSIQNLFMIFSTGLRNSMYIDEALLSYKRIGVYFWLLFAVVGLITLLIKLNRNKTVWFLARHNFVALFIVLIASSSIDWDMLISKFNVNRALARDEISSFDKRYMLSLSEGNIAELYKIKDIKGFEENPDYSYSSFSRNFLSNKGQLDYRLYQFLNGNTEGDWRSYSIRRNRVEKDIIMLDINRAIDTLDLKGYHSIDLAALSRLKNLRKLNLTNCYIDDWSELKHHKFLETLLVSDLKEKDVPHFKQLASLKKLRIMETDHEVTNHFKQELEGVTVY